MRTVLFLEPRDEFRSAHTNALRSAGYDVIAVHDPQGALDALNTRLPDVVVARLDLRTREDHLSFCRQVKSDRRTRHISILLATAQTISADDVGLATDPGVLVLTVPDDNGNKLVAAIQGVLAA